MIREAADRIESASISGQPVSPVRSLIGADDIGAAYAVQQELTTRRIASGGVVDGRKSASLLLSCNSNLGSTSPDFGFLFADMDVSDEPLVSYGRLLQPKVEAEIAFVLKDDRLTVMTGLRLQSRWLGAETGRRRQPRGFDPGCSPTTPRLRSWRSWT